MSDCCAVQPAQALTCCTACGRDGQVVERATVAALILGPVPERQNFWLCRSPDCGVAYFGDRGAQLGVSELRFLPAFKSESPEALVCFCFLHRREEIESEVRDPATSLLFEQIAAKVKAGHCACEVRNPSGRCCLGEVKAETERLRGALLAPRPAEA